MEIDISKMTMSDFDEIKDILLTDFDDFWSLDVLKNELISDNSIYFVAKFDKKIVGFVGAKIILDEAEIMNIVVCKDYRGNGIGCKLLKFILSELKNSNCNIVHLEVNEQNIQAFKLYKKIGFTEIGRRKNYYNYFDKNFDAILMNFIF